MSESIYPIISRKEAKAQGLTRYFTGIPCIHGHVCEKLVSNHSCIECGRIYSKEKAKTPKIGEQQSIYPIITQTAAIEQGLKYYFTGKPCKWGHLSKRRSSGGHCITCAREDKKSDRSREHAKEYEKTAKSKESRNSYHKSDKGRENRREYEKSKRATDPLFKLKSDIRALIGNSMKRGGFKKSSQTAKILGCSFEFFKQHIENHFTEGMCWENHGQWHYDHIYPVARAIDEAHMIELNHYSNFQPLWALDNILKGSNIPEGY